MKITKLNIEIKAIKNYQTFALGAEIEAEEPINMVVLTQIEEKLMNEAVLQIDNLCKKLNLNEAEPIKIQKTQYQEPKKDCFYNQVVRSVPKYNNQRYNTNNNLSEKQIQILKSNGYRDEDIRNIDKRTGAEIIKEIIERGNSNNRNYNNKETCTLLLYPNINFVVSDIFKMFPDG